MIGVNKADIPDLAEVSLQLITPSSVFYLL